MSFIGEAFFTVAFGALWSKTARGSYWGWDPKENGALITRLTHTTYRHMRLVKEMHGKIPTMVSIAG